MQLNIFYLIEFPDKQMTLESLDQPAGKPVFFFFHSWSPLIFHSVQTFQLSRIYSEFATAILYLDLDHDSIEFAEIPK